LTSSHQHRDSAIEKYQDLLRRATTITVADSYGGTGDIIRYAEEVRKSTIVIAAKTHS
jgi:hypothetical protein